MPPCGVNFELRGCICRVEGIDRCARSYLSLQFPGCAGPNLRYSSHCRRWSPQRLKFNRQREKVPARVKFEATKSRRVRCKKIYRISAVIRSEDKRFFYKKIKEKLSIQKICSHSPQNGNSPCHLPWLLHFSRLCLEK